MQKNSLLTNHCSDYGTARPRTGKSRQQQPDIAPEMGGPGGSRSDRSPFIARSKAMTKDDDQTKSKAPEFDLSAFPSDALFHERRYGHDRRTPPAGPGTTAGSPPNLERVRPERRARKERRKRIDPTTFEKQYTEDELEFMNAMRRASRNRPAEPSRPMARSSESLSRWDIACRSRRSRPLPWTAAEPPPSEIPDPLKSTLIKRPILDAPG